MKTEDVDDNDFISEIWTWESKGHQPLEKIKILDTSNGGKTPAILSYTDLETYLFLGEKSYDRGIEKSELLDWVMAKLKDQIHP